MEFKFTAENKKKAEEICKNYPADKRSSAVMSLLHLAQEQEGWISTEAMDYVAKFLDMLPIKVYEVASFYTMYNKKPVGKYLIQVCRTTPCWLRGAEEIKNSCLKNLNINLGDTTKDGMFTVIEVECLGGCVNAPVVQINNDYYEDLDSEFMLEIIVQIKKNKKLPKAGSSIGRQCSAPEGIKERDEEKVIDEQAL